MNITEYDDILKQLLSGRAVISLPEMQARLGTSYREVRILASFAEARGWVTPPTDGGNLYRIRSRSFDFPHKSASEIKEICSKLAAIEIRGLTYMLEHPIIDFKTFEGALPSFAHADHIANKLVECGLIFMSDGYCFLNVSRANKDTIEREAPKAIQRRRPSFFNN